MKINLNTYQIIMIILFIANIIGGYIIAMFMRWMKSEIKNFKSDFVSEINLLKKDLENNNELLDQKLKFEVTSRKNECDNHEKKSNIIFNKIDNIYEKIDKFIESINDRFIKAIVSLENMDK